MQDAARTFRSRKEGLAEKMMAWEAGWPNLGVEVSDRGMEQKRSRVRWAHTSVTNS